MWHQFRFKFSFYLFSLLLLFFGRWSCFHFKGITSDLGTFVHKWYAWMLLIFLELFLFTFSADGTIRTAWTDTACRLHLKQVHHTPHEQVRAEETRGQREDEASESTEEEDLKRETRCKSVKEGALRSSAFRTDKRRNGHSSVQSDLEEQREGCSRAARPRELSEERSSRDVVYTTLHVLPRPEGERCRPSTSTLPRLPTGQQAHSKHLTEPQKVRSNCRWSSCLLSYTVSIF